MTPACIVFCLTALCGTLEWEDMGAESYRLPTGEVVVPVCAAGRCKWTPPREYWDENGWIDIPAFREMLQLGPAGGYMEVDCTRGEAACKMGGRYVCD